jgi:hypothetical protein
MPSCERPLATAASTCGDRAQRTQRTLPATQQFVILPSEEMVCPSPGAVAAGYGPDRYRI